MFYHHDEQFTFGCKIVIGDGQNFTYFSDRSKQLLFNYTPAVIDEVLIDVKANSTLTLGYLVNATTKTVAWGCALFANDNEAGWVYRRETYIKGYAQSVIYLYGCLFVNVAESADQLLFDSGDVNSRVWGCTFGNMVRVKNFAGSMFDCSFQNYQSKVGGYPAVQSFASSAVVDNVIVKGFGVVAQVSYSANNSDLYFRNLYARDNSYLCEFYASVERFVDVYFVDCDSDSWALRWTDVYENKTVLYRQVSFDLFVLNGALTDFVEDANVTLVHNGAVLGSWLTNSTGQIATQTLTYGFYNSTGGNSMYGGTAWTLTITHPDWTTYTSVFYPYSKIEWSISMQDTSTADNNMVTIGLLLGGIAFLGIIIIRRKQ